MTATFDEYDAAVRAFWTGRDLQTQKQTESGKRDAGTRGSVTGGGHLDAMHDLIARQFGPLRDWGAEIRQSGKIPIPGHYRRSKNWDIVITHRGVLVATLGVTNETHRTRHHGTHHGNPSEVRC